MFLVPIMSLVYPENVHGKTRKTKQSCIALAPVPGRSYPIPTLSVPKYNRSPGYLYNIAAPAL